MNSQDTSFRLQVRWCGCYEGNCVVKAMMIKLCGRKVVNKQGNKRIGASLERRHRLFKFKFEDPQTAPYARASSSLPSLFALPFRSQRWDELGLFHFYLQHSSMR